MVPYGPLWFVWSPIIPYGPLWSHMLPHGPIWSCIVLFGLVWSCMVLYGPLWSHMVSYGPVRSSMFLYGLVCSGMVMYCPVWSCMFPYDPLWSWSCMVFKILTSPTALLSPVRYQILADIESFAFLFKLEMDFLKFPWFSWTLLFPGIVNFHVELSGVTLTVPGFLSPLELDKVEFSHRRWVTAPILHP